MLVTLLSLENQRLRVHLTIGFKYLKNKILILCLRCWLQSEISRYRYALVVTNDFNF